MSTTPEVPEPAQRPQPEATQPPVSQPDSTEPLPTQQHPQVAATEPLPRQPAAPAPAPQAPPVQPGYPQQQYPQPQHPQLGQDAAELQALRAQAEAYARSAPQQPDAATGLFGRFRKPHQPLYHAMPGPSESPLYGLPLPAHTRPQGYPPAAEPAAAPTQPAPTTTEPRRRGIWLPVTAAAAGAALLATLGTAACFVGFADDSSPAPSSLSSIGQSTNASVPVAGSSSDDPDWEKVASAVQASVVAIEVTTASGAAQGSGVIIDDVGNVVTNNHVVAGAEGDVQVTLTDGRIVTATIVGTDATTDLAVIRINDAPDDLSPAAFGDSDDVVVGQPVMAVGNPLGLASTVTTGIVSAVDRPVSTSETGSDTVVTNAIQIDAAVNPGNSGGPLFDAQGRVVGITSSIATLSSSSGSIGLGFAIPVNLASDIAAQLIDTGTAEHAFLGVGLTDGTATADGTTRRGAVVKEISDGSPAAEAGVQVDDVIVAIDGKPVGGAESLTAYVRARAAGSEATLTIVRDGSAIDVSVTLATRVEAATSEDSDSSDGSDGSDGSDEETIPGDMTPDELWQWFQEQQQGQGSSQGDQG